MCKCCESQASILMTFDNRRSMDVYCDQYQGVNVCAQLGMVGNMLELNGGGSYRSKSDCYYESEGLEIDNKYSKRARSSYLKIQYCPFCGKKLNSTVYEKTIATEQIELLQKELEKTKEDLKYYHLTMSIVWEYPNRKPKCDYWHIMQEGKEHWMDDENFTIEELVQKGAKISFEILYEAEKGWDNPDEALLNFEDKIECNLVHYGQLESRWYIVTEETLDKLQKMKLLPRIERKKIAKLNKDKENLLQKAKTIEDTIDKLNEELKSYE